MKNNTITKRDYYHILCPDGKYRNCPYGMEDDAEFDAEQYSTGKKFKYGCNNPKYVIQDPNDPPQSICPGGLHTVVKGITL